MNKILIKTTEKVKLRNPISENKYLPKGCVGEVDEDLYENQDYFYVNFQSVPQRKVSESRHSDQKLNLFQVDLCYIIYILS